MGKLDGKVAIITGASGGIGRVAAVLFAGEGAKVVVASRNIEAGQETVRIIEEAGGEAIFIRTDVDTYGSLDVLYNNAGIVHEPASTVDIKVEEWEKTIAINLTGSWLGMKFAIPEMIKAGGGSIINTASLAAQVGVPNQIAYSAITVLLPDQSLPPC